MIAITKDYLADIIFRLINKTIETHRQSKANDGSYEKYPVATDLEILDFIQSIPYFDVKLKDFIAGNLTEVTIIISQAWEIEFFKKAKLWAESFEWLQGNDYFLTDAHINSIKSNEAFLTLPY